MGERIDRSFGTVYILRLFLCVLGVRLHMGKFGFMDEVLLVIFVILRRV